MSKKTISNKLMKTMLYEFREGKFANSTILPKEEELAKLFQISRTALRDLLKNLEEEGYIIRVKKKGTIINRRVLDLPFRLDIEYEFKDLLEMSGYKQSQKFLGLERVEASEKVAQQLEIKVGSPLLIAKKVVFANKKPVILCYDYLNLAMFKTLPEEKDCYPNIFALIENQTKERIDFNITKIIPINPPKEVSKLLKVNSPLIKIEDVSFNSHGKPVLFADIFWHGDFFNFHLVRKRYL